MVWGLQKNIYPYKDTVNLLCPLNQCIHITFNGTACNELSVFPGLEIDPMYVKCLKLYTDKLYSLHPLPTAP
jgi:hypothetical protein